MEGKKFATAIACIDGRFHQQLTDWIVDEYGVDYVDMPTIPGPDKVVSEDSEFAEALKYGVGISNKGHHSELLVMTGHEDCAANPISNDEHKEQIKKSVENLKSWGFSGQIIGVFIDIDCNCEIVA